MDEVVEAQEKFKGLVPLVYDIESMGLEKAKPAEYEYSVYNRLRERCHPLGWRMKAAEVILDKSAVASSHPLGCG